MKPIAKHLPHYFSLAGILFAGAWGIAYFYYNWVFQAIIAISVAISYVVWGIIHHWLHHDLTVEVVVEYLAIAAFGLTIVFALVLRS